MVYLFHLSQPSFSFFNINLLLPTSLSLLKFRTKLKQKEHTQHSQISFQRDWKVLEVMESTLKEIDFDIYLGSRTWLETSLNCPKVNRRILK